MSPKSGVLFVKEGKQTIARLPNMLEESLSGKLAHVNPTRDTKSHHVTKEIGYKSRTSDDSL